MKIIKLSLLLTSFIFLCTGMPIAAKEETVDPIVVELQTESQLLPIYLSHITDQHSKFEGAFIENLEDVVRFDLANNGMTSLIPTSNSLDALTKSGKYSANDTEKFRTSGVYYVIRAWVEDKNLNAEVFSISGNWTKTISAIPLTGNLQQDRHQAHLLADMIHKALFGKEGIARTRVVYTLKKGLPGQKNAISDIWESDYDGANARQVVFDAGYCVTPQYAPPQPGKQTRNLIFASYKTGQPKIYTASTKDGKCHRLTYLKGNQLMPTLSYKRDQIAFISDVTGNPDLFLQDFSPEEGAIGKPRQIYAGRLATQGTPSFSPDGKQIAFVTNTDGSPRIYVIDTPKPGTKLKDTKAKLITKYRRGCTAPAWSPDGKKIAYCAAIDGVRQIFVYDLNKGSERQITQGPLNKENASWAPNSLHLIYNGSTPNSSELYITNLNQLVPIKISSGSGDKRFPSWEPWGL
jgi:TolB protein